MIVVCYGRGETNTNQCIISSFYIIEYIVKCKFILLFCFLVNFKSYLLASGHIEGIFAQACSGIKRQTKLTVLNKIISNTKNDYKGDDER